jgi:AcrR family transcriptional regulator
MSRADNQNKHRRYVTPVRDARAAATRVRIRAAAETLFLENGYLRTSMSEVAKRAGVAEKTVYLAFPTKAALLNEIIVSSIRDADSDRPFREQMAEALAAPAAEMIELFADINAELMERTARVMALGESAVRADPQLTEFRERGHAAMRSNFRSVAEALAAQEALPPGLDVEAAAATIYGIVNESVYLRLVDGFGWTATRYRDWLACVLAELLLSESRMNRS